MCGLIKTSAVYTTCAAGTGRHLCTIHRRRWIWWWVKYR